MALPRCSSLTANSRHPPGCSHETLLASSLQASNGHFATSSSMLTMGFCRQRPSHRIVMFDENPFHHAQDAGSHLMTLRQPRVGMSTKNVLMSSRGQSQPKTVEIDVHHVTLLLFPSHAFSGLHDFLNFAVHHEAWASSVSSPLPSSSSNDNLARLHDLFVQLAAQTLQAPLRPR